MATDTIAPAEAQSLPETTAPAGEPTFIPESTQTPLTVPLGEQLASLDAEQLQSVIDKLGGNAGPPPPGRLADADFQLPVEPTPAAPPAAETAAPATAEAAPAEATPAATPKAEATPPPAEVQENPPGRIRIDRITDERTRQILEFQSRNHDATIEDAIAYVDGQRQAQQPAPAGQAFAGPDVAGMQARVNELTQRLKEEANPMRTDYNGAAVAELQGQLLDAKVDLRFAQDQASRQQAAVKEQRVSDRQTSMNTAVAMCPEVNDPDSPQGREFTRLFNEYTAKGDPILQSDNVPTLIVLQAMHATGYTPKGATPAPEAAPAAPLAPAPAKPATPTVRTTVPVNGVVPTQPTAPGNARLNQPSLPTQADLMAAIGSMDLGTLNQVVAKAGEKLAPPARPFSMA